MLAPITHILPLATVIRKRMLPVDGRILAKQGQKVNSSDIVAETVVGRKHTIIDVAQQLHVSARQATAFIKIKKGQKISKDEVIAESNGLFAHEVTSPIDGRVVAMGGGKVILETGGSRLDLVAGISGVVTEIIGDRGVVIRSTGSIIQGLWGNGRIEAGVMISLLEKPDEIFDPNRLEVSQRGSIVLGGHVNDAAVIKNAAELPVRGLILSSMSPALITVASQATFPIVLMEGFGRRPMNSVAYKLLSTNVKRDVALNAEVYDKLAGTRPEVFIPLPVSQDPPEPREIETFAAGQNVRIVNLLRPSQIGTLLQLRSAPVGLSNGLRVRAAEVQLESGEQVLVPLTNLELLG